MEIPLTSEVDTIIGFYHNVTHPGINTTIAESETSTTGVEFTTTLKTL